MTFIYLIFTITGYIINNHKTMLEIVFDMGNWPFSVPGIPRNWNLVREWETYVFLGVFFNKNILKCYQMSSVI